VEGACQNSTSVSLGRVDKDYEDLLGAMGCDLLTKEGGRFGGAGSSVG
jgi:hypothetical protein